MLSFSFSVECFFFFFFDWQGVTATSGSTQALEQPVAELTSNIRSKDKLTCGGLMWKRSTGPVWLTEPREATRAASATCHKPTNTRSYQWRRRKQSDAHWPPPSGNIGNWLVHTASVLRSQSRGIDSVPLGVSTFWRRLAEVDSERQIEEERDFNNFELSVCTRWAAQRISLAADLLGFSHSDTSWLCRKWPKKERIPGEWRLRWGGRCRLDMTGQSRMTGRRVWDTEKQQEPLEWIEMKISQVSLCLLQYLNSYIAAINQTFLPCLVLFLFTYLIWVFFFLLGEL